MSNAYQKLKRNFSDIAQLVYIERIMMWDESVMMPEGAGETRAQSMATLNCIIQKMLSEPANKKLLEEAKQEKLASIWDQTNLKMMEKQYIRATCIPAELTEELTKETMACQQVWRKLRAQNNWAEFLPSLKKTFELTKEVAKRRADALQLSVYDALLDEYAPGFNQSAIDKIFVGLKQEIPELVQAIIKKQSSEHVDVPVGPFAMEQQKQLGLKAMELLQFDFNHGRVDVSHHPFCSGGPTDVRITTRYNEREFISSLLGICHETGHGLYEQGLPKDWIDQPVGNVNSMAMHESQSLLIEKQICGSLAFYQYLTPMIQELFGKQQAFNVANMHKVATRVKPNFIRVDADEVSYQMHIILRYEIEKMLFNDEIKIENLPEVWDELMQKYLGLSTKGNDKDGAMQDVHWPSGAFGYFPAYSLGRLIASQLFATFIKSHPDFFAELAQGQFQTLKKWLHDNVHSQASSMDTNNLLLVVTGQPLASSHFIHYVKQQYLA